VAGVIHVSGIRKTYGKTVALNEVSFEVNDGEIAFARSHESRR
jgi:ABC-type multidrug transport system ATPase subunit